MFICKTFLWSVTWVQSIRMHRKLLNAKTQTKRPVVAQRVLACIKRLIYILF